MEIRIGVAMQCTTQSAEAQMPRLSAEKVEDRSEVFINGKKVFRYCNSIIVLEFCLCSTGTAMSCRTGLLRGGRAFARLFNLSRRTKQQRSSRGSESSISYQREDQRRSRHQDRYTRHEVTAPRAVGPSGRT